MGYDTYPSGEGVARRKPECSGQRNGRDLSARQTARRGAQQKMTMKQKLNYAELEKRIDFTALAGRLGQLTEQDNPQRKTVFTLLDKVREQILAARRNHNVSYRVLARELTSAGIPVSEPTLRKYIRTQGAEKKPRHKATPKIGHGDGKPAVPAANAVSKPAAPMKQHRFNLDV